MYIQLQPMSEGPHTHHVASAHTSKLVRHSQFCVAWSTFGRWILGQELCRSSSIFGGPFGQNIVDTGKSDCVLQRAGVRRGERREWACPLAHGPPGPTTHRPSSRCTLCSPSPPPNLSFSLESVFNYLFVSLYITLSAFLLHRRHSHLLRLLSYDLVQMPPHLPSFTNSLRHK